MKRLSVLVVFLLIASGAFAQRMTVLGAGGAFTVTPSYTGPCDVAATASTPCVAAYSVIRAMTQSYIASGTAFVLQRTSDSATLNVGFNTSGASYGLVNLTPIASFCTATTCKYSNLCDQITGQCATGVNDLPQATAANQAPYGTVTTPGGGTIAIITTAGGQFYRNRTNTSGIPTGANPITEYYVASNSTVGACCGTFGNMETTVADTGDGHMFALGFLQGPLGGVVLDRENGNFLPVSGWPPAFFMEVAKHTGSTTTMKVGSVYNVASLTGQFPTIYSGADPVTFHMEGGLSLGEGGDSGAAPTAFFEGAVMATATSDATDNSIQAGLSIPFGATVAPSYVGPGDQAVYALESYSASYCYDHSQAAAGVNALVVKRASDNSSLTLTCQSNGTVQSGATFCNSTTCTVTTLYDTTGNGITMTAINAPSLVFSGCSSGVSQCLQFASASTQSMASVFVSAPAQNTFAAVSQRISGGAEAMLAFRASDVIAYPAGANTMSIFNSNLSHSATDGAWHAAIGVNNGPSSSAINVDGAETTGSGSGGGIINTPSQMGFNNNVQYLNGYIDFATIYGWPMSSTQRGGMHTILSGLYGTP